MIGAMIILMSLMKASPRGLIAVPVSRIEIARRTPRMMAQMTWK
jgi:hypothetical protein